MFLFWGSPKVKDDPWAVRRWFAVVAFRLVALKGILVVCLFMYALMNGAAEGVDVVAWGVIIGTFVTAETTIVAKYCHDATTDQKHEREQEKGADQ